MHQPRFKRRKLLFLFLLIPACIAAFGFIVMSLWNAILPEVIHVNPITFWQAIGILILSKILFSGFHGRGWHRGDFRERLKEKWHHMSPEEKENFKNQWRDRCMKFGHPFNKPAYQQGEPGAD